MTQPFDPLMPDLYTGDAPADWAALGRAGDPWRFATVKVSQGLGYQSGSWLTHAWAELAKTPLRRGAYHYLSMALDGKAQAQFFLKLVAGAGGYRRGDLWPIVDVETASNEHASKQQVIDCTSLFARTIMAETGRKTLLYGGSLMYDLGITSHMECSYLWIARYSATLPPEVYQRIGWSLPQLAFWQYAAGADKLHSQLRTKDGSLYPDSAPGCGPVDVSVLTFPGGYAGISAELDGEIALPDTRPRT